MKSGFISRRYSANTPKHLLERVTSLSVSNYGDTDAFVTVNDVTRKVPAFNAAIGVPMGVFNIPGDGTACDIYITIDFQNNSGDVILDYRTLKTC